MKKLFEKRAAARAGMQELLDNAKNEERAFTDEENESFTALEAEIAALDRTIAAEERAAGISGRAVPAAQDNDRTRTEERAFLDFISGSAAEMRAGEQNVTMANNSAIIPSSISSRIIDTVTDMCPILAGAEVYHVKGTLKIPKWTKANTTHDITVAYASEFSELTADSGRFDSVDLSGYLAGALVLIGRSVINNSAIDAAGFIVRKIAEKVALFIEGELLAGTGSNAAQGALNTSNSVTSAAAAAVSFDDLVKLQSAVKQAYQGNACWTMNPETFTAIKLLKDTNGRPLTEPDAAKAFPYTLLGKPVYLSDNMPKAAAGKTSILYGDYSGLSVNFREDIGIEVLREVYHTQHAVGIDAWFEFDSRITDEQKLAVLRQKAS